MGDLATLKSTMGAQEATIGAAIVQDVTGISGLPTTSASINLTPFSVTETPAHTGPPTPAPTVTGCGPDDASIDCGVLMAPHCEYAMSSRRRAMGGVAADRCQTTCSSALGCVSCSSFATSSACSTSLCVWTDGSCQTPTFAPTSPTAMPTYMPTY